MAWKLTVRVLPNARKAGIELSDGGVRVKVTAPAVDGKANSALIAYVAKVLGIRKSKLAITRGEHVRIKTLSIDTPEPADLEALLKEFTKGKNRQDTAQ